MSLRDLAIDRLLAVDPKRSTLHTLNLLMAHANAEQAGVFLLRGSVVELFAGQGVDQPSLDWLRKQWDTHREGLRDGQPVFEGPRCVWPLGGSSGPEQIGALYLAGGEDLAPSSVRAAVGAIGDLLERSLAMADGMRQFSPAIDQYLKSTPPEGVLRRQLEGLLHENEWNVSRVARILGVTRVTVYARMQRLGIERLRVPKART